MSKVIGIDLGGTNIVGAVMDGNEIVLEVKNPTEAALGSERVLDNITRTINKLLEKYPDIKNIGIGTPGAVSEDGIVSGAFNIDGWHGTDLYGELKNRISSDVNIVGGNDVDVAALGESRFGNQDKSKVMLFVALGTGIGGGVVIDDKIYYGASGNAAEIGHMTIDLNGRSCTCGKKGCFETYCSATGIKRTFEEEFKKSGDNISCSLLDEMAMENITTKDIYDYAKKGDLFCQQVTNVVNYHMAVGLGNLANIFNPDLLVIGGGVSLAGEYFFNPLIKELKNHCFEKTYSELKIVSSNLQDRAGLYGACALAIKG